MDKKNQNGKKPFRDFDLEDYNSFEKQKRKTNDRRLNEKRHKDKRDKFEDWN